LCLIRKLFGERSIGFYNALHARALIGIFRFVWHCSNDWNNPGWNFVLIPEELDKGFFVG
jgi:hypothetical protein